MYLMLNPSHKNGKNIRSCSDFLI